MCARKSRPLSYPLHLPDELQAPALDLLAFSLPYEQQVIDALWPCLDEIGQVGGKHIWKSLEGRLPRPEDTPSRPWRCILEGGGRVLRAQADRKRIFDLLLPLIQEEDLADADLTGLAYRLRNELNGNGDKIGYLLNVVEQMGNFYAQHDRLPADYYECQSKPTLKTPQLPFAADDGAVKGQVYRMRIEDGRIALRLKYPHAGGEWRHTPYVSFPLPEAIDATVPLAPTLRLKRIKGGKVVAVLDLIVEDQTPQREPTGDNVLAFDWGVRRLLSFTILSRAGEQLTPPGFVDIGGLAGKQARRRQQISALHAKKSKLRKKDRARVQAEIDACWRKYGATNEALAHFASNLLITFALLFDCNLIAGEWLKTLKARRKGSKRRLRTLNWKINTTIREVIWTKLVYKVKRYSIKTKRVWPRGSSHECPRCGQTGVTCKSPEHRSQVSPYGHWFYCTNSRCSFNADRDYVASLNIGRRALAKDYPSDKKDKVECQPVSYTGTGATLPFPSPDALQDVVRCASTADDKVLPRSNAARLLPGGQIRLSYLLRLGTTLTGFDKAIALKPKWLPGYG